MRVYWQDRDISTYTNVSECVYRESSTGEADLLDIRMYQPEAWNRWGPELDDEIRIENMGIDTGIMYLNAIAPEGRCFRVLATSTRSAAARQAWGGYKNMSLWTIMHNLAAECGMTAKLYGIDGGYTYEYLQRENEGPAAFLARLTGQEGMAMKAVSGCYRGIYIPWAQERDPVASITVTAGQEGAIHISRQREKWSRLTVKSPWAESSATDTGAAGRPEKMINLPVRDAATAGRWARGLLLEHNRQCESLDISMKINARMRCMERVDVGGNTTANGEWIVNRAEHDLVNGETRVQMLRVISGIR